MSRVSNILTTTLILGLAGGALLLMTAALSHAEMPVNTVGAGLIFGEPTGFSAEYTLMPGNAIDAALAYSYIGTSDWQVHADYLWTGKRFFGNETAGLEEYFGLGARLKFEDPAEFGIRIPGGATYQVNQTSNFQFFGEVAPIVDLVNGIGLNINLGIGVRYFF